MKRDLTMVGVGFIVGNLGVQLFSQTITVGNAVSIGIGLLLIVGSRYGIFGKTT